MSATLEFHNIPWCGMTDDREAEICNLIDSLGGSPPSIRDSEEYEEWLETHWADAFTFLNIYDKTPEAIRATTGNDPCTDYPYADCAFVGGRLIYAFVGCSSVWGGENEVEESLIRSHVAKEVKGLWELLERYSAEDLHAEVDA